jgi:shikimate kinase / 3-dehydroquinate synthase
MLDNANIVLCGFMGTGKTSVGQRLAAVMSRPFIDMDTLLEQRLGAPIADVFARSGEALFREAERALCRELSTPAGTVIAAGGGAVIDQASRLDLAQGGLLFCLTCAPAECLRRIGDPASRPMLRGGDPAERLALLMAERSAAYATIPRHIDTTALSIDEVATAVTGLYRRDSSERVLPVRHDAGSYDIVFAEGALGRLGELLAARGLGGRAAVVTNSVVGPLYGERAANSLSNAGIRPLMVDIPDGEQAKTLDTVASLYDRMAEAGLERGDAIVALGGGVVGDIAGLAAATYLRGVPFVQVPSTVLSMVDSSVGGKVGVDHPRGKNLIGAFKQPALVVADPALLLSLPASERRSGLAEVIKHGVIAMPAILEHIEAQAAHGQAPDLVWLIAEAVRVKIDIVEEDPYERGRRAELNLGHTFGHALEVMSGYRTRHGEAVSIGMVIACRVAEKMGLCDADLTRRVETLLGSVGLPARHAGYAAQDIWAAMASDKKRKDGRLRFVLPLHAGKVIVTDHVAQQTVLEALRETGE